MCVFHTFNSFTRNDGFTVSEHGDDFGFTALLYADVNVHIRETIKCTVKNNYGSHYDGNTEIFKTGLCVFFFSIEDKNGDVRADLVRDWSVISAIFCQSYSQFAQSGGVTVTSLFSGSSVWIKIRGNPTYQIHEKTSFVGVRIQ